MTQVLLIQFLGEARFRTIAYFMREARVEQRLQWMTHSGPGGEHSIR